MDWKELYRQKKCTGDEAMKLLKSGDHVVLSHCISEPAALVEAMVKNKHLYKDITVSHMGSGGSGAYSLKENSDSFRFEGWFASGNTNKSIAEGHGDFVPVFFHEIPKLIRNGTIPVDVLMVMVSPPDKYGYCSFGVASDYTVQASETAKVVIAQVNNKVPYTYGETFIHVSQMDAIVEADTDLPEVPRIEIKEAEEKIGKYCASLVEDGATLQLGIGAIPDALLAQMHDKKDLGVHTEMISDSIVDLVQEGIITGAKKAIDRKKIVGTFVQGTRRLYDFVDKNPLIELRPANYVNHPMTIAQQSKMVSINSCIQVDFMGQVVSDSIGIRQYSGVGGQVDFIRGTAMSLDEKGISIIAMVSVAKKKDGTKISKIVPYIDKGAAVTTSRNDVDYIVTEYGIAKLKGKNLKDRARALIEIAHPDFREELKQEFEKRFAAAY